MMNSEPEMERGLALCPRSSVRTGQSPTWLLLSFQRVLQLLTEKRKTEMPEAGRHLGTKKDYKSGKEERKIIEYKI